DFGDRETAAVERHGQRGRQAPGSDDGDGRIAGCRFSGHSIGHRPSANRFSAQPRSIPYIVVMAKAAGAKSAAIKSASARVLSSRVNYQGPVFSVTTDEVEEPGGVRARRDVVRHSGSVVVLAVDDPGKAAGKAEPRILLERQYRHAAQSMMWELPAGR